MRITEGQVKIEECSMILTTKVLNREGERSGDFWGTADHLWIVTLFYLIF